jgi:hypothetical protein
LIIQCGIQNVKRFGTKRGNFIVMIETLKLDLLFLLKFGIMDQNFGAKRGNVIVRIETLKLNLLFLL